MDFVQELIKYQPDIRAFVYSLLPRNENVEDIIQDTNVLLWTKQQSYKKGSNFRSWAFAFASNLVKEHRRTVAVRAKKMFEIEVMEMLERSWDNSDTKYQLNQTVALDFCLQKLSKSERDVIDARYSQGNSLEQHANRKGTSAQALRVILFRLRKKLRDCVTKRIFMDRRIN